MSRKVFDSCVPTYETSLRMRVKHPQNILVDLYVNLKIDFQVFNSPSEPEVMRTSQSSAHMTKCS